MPHVLSIDELDKKYQVTANGRKDANDGYPPTNQEGLGGSERNIRSAIIQEQVNDRHGEFSKLLVAEHDQRSKLHIHETISRIHYAPTDAQAELDLLEDNWLNELVPLELETLHANADYKLFKAENNLKREPHYPESQIFHWSFIALIALVESILNGFFLARGSEWGLIGGLSSALIITAVNMLYAWAVGTYFLRQVWHIDIWRKVLNLFVVVVLTAFIVVFYLLIGHLRAVIQEDPLEAARLAMESFNVDPFGISNVYGWILIGVSAGVALVAIIKFLFADDLYPGFGRVHRKLKATEAKVAERRTQYQKERLDVIRDKEKGLGVLRIEADQFLQKYEISLNHSRQIVNAYKNAISQAQKNYSTLINRYRSANLSVRPTTAPEYFDREEQIPPEMIPELDLFQFELDEKRLPELRGQYETVPQLYDSSTKALDDLKAENARKVQEFLTKVKSQAASSFHHQEA